MRYLVMVVRSPAAEPATKLIETIVKFALFILDPLLKQGANLLVKAPEIVER
jgi:hypothetical protein